MMLFIIQFIYLLFLWWYQGIGKRVSLNEENDLVTKLDNVTREHDSFDEELQQVIKRFLMEDDGKGFVMVNLMKIGERNNELQKNKENYSTPFLRRLLFHAGLPVLYSKVLANYIEHWGLANAVRVGT